MTAALWALGAAIAFAFTAYAAVAASRAVCRTAVPFDDGPRPGKPPVVGLVLGGTVVGALLGWRHGDIVTLAVSAALTFGFVASWYSDVRCGIVPDRFTLLPLAAVLACAVTVTHSYVPLLSSLVVFVPFAVAALLSRGYGMGWGDVKLVALGGAVLDMHVAVVALAAACLVAAGVAQLRGRHSEPIAFVPYIAACMAVALVLPAAI